MHIYLSSVPSFSVGLAKGCSPFVHIYKMKNSKKELIFSNETPDSDMK